MNKHEAHGVATAARPPATSGGTAPTRRARRKGRRGRQPAQHTRHSPKSHESAIVARPQAAGRSIVTGLFLVSGATSLIYETIWARQLHWVFGTSQLAICTLLAAFMGGLAIGAFAAARWGDRVNRPLMAYAVLEAIIGAYALAFPFILKLATPWYLGAWQLLEPGPALSGLMQFLMLGTLLLPPTICMGATLPLLVRHVVDEDRQTGRRIGRLYGANTIGAVIGTAAAGFLLLPWLGLAWTTTLAAATNGLLAVGAFALSRRCDAARPTPPGTDQRQDRVGRVPAGLLLVAALAGLSALIHEAAWFRLMSLMLGGSAYAFSTMLLAFLLGIGIGGWVGGSWADRRYARGGRAATLRTLVGLQVGAGLLAWAALYAFGQVPFAYAWIYTLVENSLGWLWPALLLMALLIMFPPCLLMGMTFPFLVRAATDRPASIGGVVGRLYGVNTLGAVVGAAAAGLLLLPRLHVQGTVLTAVACNLVAALMVGAIAMGVTGSRSRRRIAAWATVTASLVALLCMAKPAWNPLLMTSGVYKYVAAFPDRSRAGMLAATVAPFDLVFYDEGLSSVVTVGRDRRSGNLWLANNGKTDASSQSDLATQLLLAHLPFAFRPDAERALVIGLASGISAGSVTLHTAPKQIDIVEIEPAIVAASHEFDEYNHRPLEDPRVRLHLNDARNHLLLTRDGTYDLVSSEPSNPWLSGVSNLFTREFFALGKRKMRPDGVWAQWIQLYGLTRDDLRSLLGTFADTYRHARLFRVDSNDLILLGSDAPLDLGSIATAGLFQVNAAVAHDLERIDVRRPEHLLGLYQCGRSALLRLARGIERNTDDNMRIEYSAPLHLHENTRAPNSRMIQRIATVPADAVADRDGFVALAKTYVTRDYGWDRVFAALDHARALQPNDPEVATLIRVFRELEASQTKRPEQPPGPR